MFVYVIFNKSTKEVFECYRNKDFCIAVFTKLYDPDLFDWKAINLNYVLRELDQ